jgi:hypothetical protein
MPGAPLSRTNSKAWRPPVEQDGESRTISCDLARSHSRHMHALVTVLSLTRVYRRREVSCISEHAMHKPSSSRPIHPGKKAELSECVEPGFVTLFLQQNATYYFCMPPTPAITCWQFVENFAEAPGATECNFLQQLFYIQKVQLRNPEKHCSDDCLKILQRNGGEAF